MVEAAGVEPSACPILQPFLKHWEKIGKDIGLTKKVRDDSPAFQKVKTYCNSPFTEGSLMFLKQKELELISPLWLFKQLGPPPFFGNFGFL